MNWLFVCTGNTCRSPMAAALAAKYLAESGIAAETASAGLSAFEGEPASAHAIYVMAGAGVDISQHRSRRVTLAMIKRADSVLAMTRAHRDALAKRFPAAAAKIFTLDGGGDIPDPYGGGRADYQACAKRIDESVRAAVQRLTKGGLYEEASCDRPSAGAKQDSDASQYRDGQ